MIRGLSARPSRKWLWVDQLLCQTTGFERGQIERSSGARSHRVKGVVALLMPVVPVFWVYTSHVFRGYPENVLGLIHPFLSEMTRRRVEFESGETVDVKVDSLMSETVIDCSRAEWL